MKRVSGESDGVAAGLAGVCVVQEPVHRCRGQGAFLVGGFHDPVESFGGVCWSLTPGSIHSWTATNGLRGRSWLLLLWINCYRHGFTTNEGFELGVFRSADLANYLIPDGDQVGPGCGPVALREGPRARCTSPEGPKSIGRLGTGRIRLAGPQSHLVGGM